jgi:hypothetical protein
VECVIAENTIPAFWGFEMKILAPVLLVLACVSPVFGQASAAAPAPKRDPNYPLQVVILGRNTAHDPNGGFWVWGSADLFSGQEEQGFDYQSDCGQLFTVSFADQRFSARWKKTNAQLEVVVDKMGNGKPEKCEMKADLKQVVYEFDPAQQGHVITKPLPNSTPAAPSGSSSNR